MWESKNQPSNYTSNVSDDSQMFVRRKFQGFPPFTFLWYEGCGGPFHIFLTSKGMRKAKGVNVHKMNFFGSKNIVLPRIRIHMSYN